jgi:cell shape-determining protein MreC
MRDIQSLSGAGTAIFIDRPHLLDVMSNVQMGVSNPREVYRMVNQEIASYNSANTNLRELQQELARQAH